MTGIRKSFSGSAVATNLTSSINSTAPTIPVGATTGWPDTSIGPFVITIDKNLSTEEKVLIASYTSSTLTVAPSGRGYDGTTAVSHGNNAPAAHTIDANTIDQANSFANSVGSVTPSTSAVGDPAADGVSLVAAAADHKHAREAFGATATNSKDGDVAAGGVAATPSRSDHVHGRTAGSGVASGAIAMFGAATAPAGWLLCDGSLVSRVTYSALFTAIGTTWGAGDGSTTFTLPDLRGSFPIGSGSSYAITAKGGEATHTLLSAEMPAHTHPLGFGDAVVYVLESTLGLSSGSGTDNHATYSESGNNSGSTGGGGAHNNLPPYTGLPFVIKT